MSSSLVAAECPIRFLSCLNCVKNGAHGMSLWIVTFSGGGVVRAEDRHEEVPGLVGRHHHRVLLVQFDLLVELGQRRAR